MLTISVKKCYTKVSLYIVRSVISAYKDFTHPNDFSWQECMQSCAFHFEMKKKVFFLCNWQNRFYPLGKFPKGLL